MDIEIVKKELINFLDNSGKLIRYPAKFKLKIMSLFFLASKFEKNRKYNESEVNEILKKWHTFEDWAMLRRDLYDRNFFDRDENGSTYWLEENQPLLEDFRLE